MAKVKVTTVVCDGCKKELPEGPGVSEVHVDENGSEFTRRLDLCPDCTKQLPEGTKRKRPTKKEGESSTAGAADKK